MRIQVDRLNQKSRALTAALVKIRDNFCVSDTFVAIWTDIIVQWARPRNSIRSSALAPYARLCHHCHVDGGDPCKSFLQRHLVECSNGIVKDDVAGSDIVDA